MPDDIQRSGDGNAAGEQERSGGLSLPDARPNVASHTAATEGREAATISAVVDDNGRNTMLRRVVEELNSNSAHYPVANAVLAILLAREAGF